MVSSPHHLPNFVVSKSSILRCPVSIAWSIVALDIVTLAIIISGSVSPPSDIKRLKVVAAKFRLFHY